MTVPGRHVNLKELLGSTVRRLEKDQCRYGVQPNCDTALLPLLLPCLGDREADSMPLRTESIGGQTSP